MLVLSRKCGERIVIPGCAMTVTVLAVKGNNVRLGITAPLDVDVYREEIWRRTGLPEQPTAAKEKEHDDGGSPS